MDNFYYLFQFKKIKKKKYKWNIIRRSAATSYGELQAKEFSCFHSSYLNIDPRFYFILVLKGDHLAKSQLPRPMERNAEMRNRQQQVRCQALLNHSRPICASWVEGGSHELVVRDSNLENTVMT